MFDMGVDLVRQALLQALLLASPVLLAGLLIGLLVSLFQTVTQIQEQTLTFVPKIACMILVAVAAIPWLAYQMIEFTSELFAGMTVFHP